MIHPRVGTLHVPWFLALAALPAASRAPLPQAPEHARDASRSAQPPAQLDETPALRRGALSPDFELPLADREPGLDGARTLRLSSWQQGRPVALVFGSYT